MKYENFKSAVLMILVLLSIVLTWNLWTYQPNYETMQNSNYVSSVTVNDKQELPKIIQPDMVIYHVKGEQYGSSNLNDLDKLMKELSQWTFGNVKNITDKISNMKEISHANGNAEIIYPSKVPIELYRGVLSFKEKTIPPFNFDRIVIDTENSDKGNGTVYFISTADKQVYSSEISPADLTDFSRNFFKNAENYPKYFAIDSGKQRTIFLPDKATDMMEYKYLPVTLNSEDFKDTLFNDPSFVQKSFVPHGEEYTNGSSKMSVNYNTNILQYVNPTAENDYVEKTYDLVKRSIDFVNEHGGWTDLYRYVYVNENNGSVTFRLYSMDGYPVFSSSGISEIKEVWGQTAINQYERPNISLDLPLRSEMQKVTLPSGHDVLQYLQNQKNIKPEQLEDLVLGYEMKRDSEENKLILLEPAWYYLYDKTWRPVLPADLGGIKHGLE